MLLLLATQIAVAQEAENPGSKLFEEGRDFAKAGKFAEACAKFEQSYALDNGVGTELNLADCHEHLGHVALAYRLFDEAAGRSANEPARAKFAHERAQALVPKLATVVVNLPDPDLEGLSVTIAGRAVKPRDVITEKADPGAIAVHVATPAKVIFDATKHADAGATAIFTVEEQPSGSPSQVAPGEPAHRSRRKLVTYTLAGAGGASVVASVVIGLVARGNYNDAKQSSDCNNQDPPTCDLVGTTKLHDAQGLADTATIFAVAGGALIAAGIVAYVVWPKEDLVVSPTATNQSAGVAISGRF